jgi:hypothetical protein
MKITLGGSMGYKIQVAQFEPLEASSYFGIEDEIESFDEDKIEMFNAKINALLQKQVNEKMKVAIVNYKENIARLKSKV